MAVILSGAQKNVLYFNLLAAFIQNEKHLLNLHLVHMAHMNV